LFNIKIDYIGGDSAYAPVVGGMSILGLFFADDLAMGLLAVNGLQNGTDEAVRCGGKGTD
jgi:hypothetical protein